MARTVDADAEEFFNYTSGRWLWNEEEQLQQRHRRFNVQELQVIAARLLGSCKCVYMTKVGEGNYNKVFRLQMDDGAVAIARIPHPNSGPRRYTTASEVATMEFAQSILNIPVPKVLAWCSTDQNPVGSEYIIMEEARGTQLTDVREDLKLSERQSIIEDIVGIEQKLLSVSFNLLGSIYFAHDHFPGCEAAEVVGDVTAATRDEVRSQFVIGPTAEREFWEKERSQMPLDRGPWKSTKDYAEAIAHREIAWISQYSKPNNAAGGFLTLPQSQSSRQEHIQLLKKYLSSFSRILPNDPDLLRPTLWHPDIHDGNLFVRDGKISSVIDWQSIWIRPLVLQARTPRLINYNGKIMLSLPNNYKDLDEDEKKRTADQVSRSLQLYLYEEQTAQRNPLLNKAIRQPHGKTMSQLVGFAGNSWDDDILPLRESLIQLERNWKDFGITDACPYHFLPDEIQKHYKEGEGFNETQDFWDMLEGKVDSSGWTTHDNFDKAVEYFSMLRKAGLDSLVGEEREEFEAQTRWVLEHTSINRDAGGQ